MQKMRKSQVYIDGIPTMVEDSLLTDGVKYYNSDMTPDTVRIQAKIDSDTAQANLEALEATDKDMVRIAEYLLDLLVVKGLITEAELPKEALANLEARRLARARV